MSFLKINKITLKSTTSILKASSPLAPKTKLNHGNNKININNNENKNEKRYYSSFSMKEDPEPPKPSRIKTLVALALIGGIGAYLYKALDNQDFMFSSRLPYQKEDLEKFKTIMKEFHKDAQRESEESNKQQQEKVEPENDNINNNKDNNINLTKQYNDNENENESIKNHEEKMKNDMVSLIESIQNQNQLSSPPSSTDEINADEREMDSETLSITDEISKLIEEHKQSEESLPDLLDVNYSVLSIIPETVKSAEEKVENVLKKFNHHHDNDNSSIVINTSSSSSSDEPKNHNITIEKEQQNEESLPDLLDVNYNILSIIPEKVKSAEEKVENVLKKFEEQYLEKVEKLISENIKLKVDFDKLIHGKDDELKRVEKEIREKYRSSLDSAIEELNKDLDEKLKDMDQFIKTKVTDNQAVLQETLEKQKSNLINIFKQQAESIKQSELEKRAITQLTQCIVDLQKLLHDQSAIDGTNGRGLLVRSFKNLADLSNYDQLIKELLSTLPEGFEKKPVIALDTLNSEFQDIAKKLRKSQLLDPNDNSLVGKAVSELASFFIIPEKGMVQGNDYDAILARTEDYLRKNNLSSAIKEMESIQQQSSQTTNINDHHLSKLTSNWIKQAKERDQLENISKLLELKLELIHKQQQQIKEQQQK
ncbi:hypothetical protein ACTFIV_000060 [Dictyostelium citrinum]